jgi:hypothetical protein
MNGWRYIGHVGTGFSHKTLEELHGRLILLKSAKSPFPGKLKDEAVTKWVKPSLVPRAATALSPAGRGAVPLDALRARIDQSSRSLPKSPP